MDSYDCSKEITITECEYYMFQKKLESPMPWIGMYIAAASVACSLAMAADAFNGFKSKKLWFPCKYFSLNAFSLTVLAVAMKLPVDLTSNMMRVNEKLARVSSLVLMSTAMGNFMTSLDSMGNNEIMLNVAALAVLVITITANVYIRMGQLGSYFYGTQGILGEEIICTVVMLILLVMFCCLSIMVPTAKKNIESMYQEMHRRSVSNKQVGWGNFNIDELRGVVRTYWVMAITGSPQFVIIRSVICVTSGVMCLLTAVTLLEAWIRMARDYNNNRLPSNYKWSIKWILPIQSIGVTLGTIAPISRWYIAAKLKSSKIGHKSFKDELKVENYWTQMLVDWRDSPLPLQIRHRKFRKLLNDAKRVLLNFCIRVQVVTVKASKLLLLISATCARVIFLCFHEPRAEMGQGFSSYVVLLEGEELPRKTVKDIGNVLDKLIQTGKKKQPKNLIKLLNKSVNFNGVIEFDSEQIQSLHSQEPPQCWSLPIVTLTSIAIALPNITGHTSDQLLRGVSEGLYFVKLIEKALNRNEELANITTAADVVWVGVELYHKWQDISLKSQRYNNMLQELSDKAKNSVTDFKTDVGDLLRENALSWPVKVIAANSMYRISQTIMQSNKENDSRTEEELFERLSVMISDILCACLTNLVRVITLKCHNSAIEDREKSVNQAALLLGEGEEILKIFQRRELPSLDPEKAAYIDEWRAFMKHNSENQVGSISAATITIPQSNGEQVIELES